MKRLYQLLFSTYFITSIYAVVRYHIFGPVLWKDLFLFTGNKIIIFSTVFFVLFLSSSKLNQKEKNILKKTVLVSIVLHIIFSTFILKPYYLKEFFDENGGLNLSANISLLFGSLASVIFILKSQIDLKPDFRNKIVVFLAMIHLLAMGGKNWFHPGEWHGGLLPITLITFVILGFVLLTRKIHH